MCVFVCFSIVLICPQIKLSKLKIKNYSFILCMWNKITYYAFNSKCIYSFMHTKYRRWREKPHKLNNLHLLWNVNITCPFVQLHKSTIRYNVVNGLKKRFVCDAAFFDVDKSIWVWEVRRRPPDNTRLSIKMHVFLFTHFPLQSIFCYHLLVICNRVYHQQLTTFAICHSFNTKYRPENQSYQNYFITRNFSFDSLKT